MRRTKGVVGRQGVKGVGVREIEQLSHVIAPHLEATTPLSSGNYIISRPHCHDLEVAGASHIGPRAQLGFPHICLKQTIYTMGFYTFLPI